MTWMCPAAKGLGEPRGSPFYRGFLVCIAIIQLTHMICDESRSTLRLITNQIPSSFTRTHLKISERCNFEISSKMVR